MDLPPFRKNNSPIIPSLILIRCWQPKVMWNSLNFPVKARFVKVLYYSKLGCVQNHFSQVYVSLGPSSSSRNKNYSDYLSASVIRICLIDFGHNRFKMDHDLPFTYGGQFCTQLTHLIYYDKYLWRTRLKCCMLLLFTA